MAAGGGGDGGDGAAAAVYLALRAFFGADLGVLAGAVASAARLCAVAGGGGNGVDGGWLG